jgi:hypothetical protein
MENQNLKQTARLPAMSPHDTDDPTDSSDLDSLPFDEFETAAARYWAGLAGEDDLFGGDEH